MLVNFENSHDCQQAKGFDKDCALSIEGVEELFKDAGKTVYVKICRTGGRHGEKKKLSEFFFLNLFTCDFFCLPVFKQLLLHDASKA